MSDKKTWNEKIDEISQSLKMVKAVVSSYVETNIKDVDKIDKQIKDFFLSLDKTFKDGVQNFKNAGSYEGLQLKLKKLEHFKGDLPKYETQLAAGFDIRACLDESLTLNPGQRMLIPTGLSFEIPEGFEVQVRPRSGLAIKQGLGVLNSPGTIDADYRGEVKVIVVNLGQEDIVIDDQMRVAQCVLCPILQPEIVEVVQLSETQRGEGGFGSTGH